MNKAKQILDIFAYHSNNPAEVGKSIVNEKYEAVGVIGNDIPPEIMLAAGCHPLRIKGGSNLEITTANHYLESGFNPNVKKIMQELLDGSYHFLKYLFISGSSDALIRLYYYLRAIQHSREKIALPTLYFYDFLHSKARSAFFYNLKRTEELIEYLQKALHLTVDHDRLLQAIELCNESRRLLTTVATLRNEKRPRLSGVQAQQIIQSSYIMMRQEYNRLLKKLLDNIELLSPIKGPRIFMTGSTQEHTEFYELVEAQGAVIIGEDHGYSTRDFTGKIKTNIHPLEAIVDYYHITRELPSSQATVSERVQALKAAVTVTNAEGVIFFIHRGDDAPAWDYPEQREMLTTLGIPSLLIDQEEYQLKNKKEIVRKLNLFLQKVSLSAVCKQGEKV